jgi:hypothetical protein
MGVNVGTSMENRDDLEPPGTTQEASGKSMKECTWVHAKEEVSFLWEGNDMCEEGCACTRGELVQQKKNAHGGRRQSSHTQL